MGMSFLCKVGEERAILKREVREWNLPDDRKKYP